jgi:FixJ family two-component response regulator
MGTEPADVVVTDVQMPGMTGIELCEQLRERHPSCAAIVVTGRGSGEVAQQARRAGASEFLTKPTKIDSLVEAIGRALEQPTS